MVATESRRERFSLFFYKIHSSTVPLSKGKCKPPLLSHESHLARHFAYSDVLNNSFFPISIPVWNSLPSTVVSAKTIEEFKTHLKLEAFD